MKYPVRCSYFLACAGAIGISGVAAQQGKKQEFRIQEPGWVTVAPTTTTVKLYGQDLNPGEIQFQKPGITGRILKVEDFAGKTDTQRKWGNRLVEVELAFSAGVMPGEHSFTLTGPGVQPEIGRLTVDLPAPEVKETEPNHDLRTPQVLPPGSVTVLGMLDNEGADVLRFDARAGETWRIEVFARRLNRETKLEPILRLRDPRLAPVKVAVDQGNDCFIEYRARLDGPHLVELFDADNRSGGDYNYRLALRKL
jgi:hypothetical protein